MFKLREIGQGEAPYQFIELAVREIGYFEKANAEGLDKVGFTLHSSDRTQNSIRVLLRRADQLDSEVVYRQIEQIIQSNEAFLLSGPFNMQVIQSPGY